MNEMIRPPRYVAGMETPLKDYSERLARRTGANADLVAAKYTAPKEPHTE